MLRAKVTIPGRGRVYCTIHNLSEEGALLGFEDGRLSMPYRFELEIEGFGVQLICEPRHTGDEGTGVRFLSGDVTALLKRIDAAAAREPAHAIGEIVATEDLLRAPPVEAVAQPAPAKRSFDALGFRRARLAASE